VKGCTYYRHSYNRRTCYDTRDARILCFSSAGFNAALSQRSKKEPIILVDLARLYGDE